jgi:phage-related minor tail protein
MVEKPSKYRAALLGGLAIGLVSAIPGLNLINCCCCAGILLGGMLTVYLYRRDIVEDMPPLEASDAAILGVMAGVVGAFAAVLFDLLLLATAGPVASEFVRSLIERLLENLEASGSIPPEAADQVRDQIEEALAQSTSVRGVLSNLFFSLVLYPIFSILGALLGYAIVRPRRKLDEPHAESR